MIFPDLAIQQSVALIMQFEGCKLAPYRDTSGNLTIGWGNRSLQDGSPVTAKTEPISQTQADRLLKGVYIYHFLPRLQALIDNDIMTHQCAAVSSLAWNIGCTAFSSSAVLRDIDNRDFLGAADAFLRWSNSRGKFNLALRARREKERAIFLGTASVSNSKPITADDLNARELAEKRS